MASSSVVGVYRSKIVEIDRYLGDPLLGGKSSTLSNGLLVKFPFINNSLKSKLFMNRPTEKRIPISAMWFHYFVVIVKGIASRLVRLFMALKLKDISNLPPNLPISHIPQQVSSVTNDSVQSQWGHGTVSGLPSMKQPTYHPHQHPQQHRVLSLSGDNDSGFEVMDDSLTDMQWLQRMDAGSDFPGLSHGQKKKGMRNGNKDGCRKKLEYTSSKKDSNKPPLSYASLIALAICSTPQRMMTLSSIYRWIEYTFPFYRTPEAKAWKNSIRHNLSIRKNMFMKVYQYPPRRGNGSYWTLLSDGEEELKKAIPLFATLQPPVIDTNCAYHREPSTHTVKSKGRFIPVLPRSDLSAHLPYFAMGNNLASGYRVYSNVNSLATEVEVEDFPENPCQYLPSCENLEGEEKEQDGVGDFEQPIKKPKHLHDHSYSKGAFHGVDDYAKEAVESEVIELATGMGEEHMTKEKNKFSALLALKRTKNDSESCYSQHTEDREPLCHDVPPALENSPPFTTPTKGHDDSLHLLDSSLLTPLKSYVPDIELGPISFSPLYTNLATPKHKVVSQMPTAEGQSQAYLPSPFTPLKGTFDSGIFSPLRTDSLGAIKFSTPTNISPLGDLNPYGLHPELCPLKVLDNSGGSTPVRPGSLRSFGLPGLTPPNAN